MSSGGLVMSEKQGFEQKHPTQTTMVSTPPRALESRLRAPQIPLSADIPLSKAVGGDQTSTTISTPTTAKDRRIEAERMMMTTNDAPASTSSRHAQKQEEEQEESIGDFSYRTPLKVPLHHVADSPGPRTYDKQYMPFAAGFAHMANEAPVYRSARLHVINPTAAASDDISYYYTLDSGRVPPAVVAANPETAAEFVRNTPSATHGGMFRRLMKPIV